MPYIVARREGVQSGSLQINDLFPNQSLANPMIDARPQGPFYIRAIDFGVEFGSIPSVNAIANKRIVAQEATGLSAYILRHVEDGAGGALTAQYAVDIAMSIKTLVHAGAVINANALNVAVAGVVLGSDFDGSQTSSTGEVEDVMKIISGEKYILSQGTEIQDAQGNFVIVLADAGFQGDVRRLVEKDASWKASLSAGTLRGLVDSQPYYSQFGGGSNQEPLVTLYNADGSLYPV